MRSLFEVDSRTHDVVTGYWGTPDALHQFCEPHYATSHYFAEFYNALSSLLFVATALYALASCKAMRSDPYIVASWVSVAIIGMGSFLFHASMKYSLELCDELPMFGYILASILGKVSSPGVHPHVRTHQESFVWSAAMVGLCVSLIVGYLILDSYSLFVNGFTLMALIDTYLGLTLYKGQEVMAWSQRSGTASAVLAKVVWEVENRMCKVQPGVWPLHVVWHVLSCAAVYYGIVCSFSNRIERGVSHGSANGRRSICMKWAIFLPFDEIQCPPN